MQETFGQFLPHVSADPPESPFDPLWASLHLSPLQLRTSKELLFILLGNIIGVLFAWWKYGDRISKRFFVTGSGSSRRNIEELRVSMSELKLPREHDFKYK